jgi:2-phosphosulpholactate phosphatase
MEPNSKLPNPNLTLEEIEETFSFPAETSKLTKIESSYRAKLRLDWGLGGVYRAKERQSLCVIVDVLNFSTTAILASANGYRLFIAANTEEALMLQQAPRNLSMGSANAWDYKEPTTTGKENTFVFPPCYGAACARVSQGVIGSTNNAKAVAEAIRVVLKENSQQHITFIACGNISSAMPYPLVPNFSVEDFIGVGAIAQHLPEYSRTPEVEAACLLFEGSKHRLEYILGLSERGNFLSTTQEEGGTSAMPYALQIDSLNVVPEFIEGYILNF